MIHWPVRRWSGSLGPLATLASWYYRARVASDLTPTDRTDFGDLSRSASERFNPRGGVRIAKGFGVILAIAGVVDGLVMALHRRVATCPDGTFFPQGTTDFTCHSHPDAGLGIAVTLLAALLGILIVLAAISADALVERRTTA